MNIYPNRSVIELDSHAFSYNSEQIKKAIGQTQLAAVIKSNAYGHGFKEIALLCQQENNINWICTASLTEALLLLSYGIEKQILVLSYLDSDYSAAVYNNIHCAIYTYEDAIFLNQAAQEIGKQAFVHVKIDTGMSRLGIWPEETIDFIKSLQKLQNLNVYGIFTHLCDTPNIDQSFSYLQLSKFDSVLDELKQAGISITCTHALSSSGLCIKPSRQYTLLRAGASLYGIWKSEEHKKLILRCYPEFDLKPVMTWKTRIIQIKTIDAGSFVGYDRTYTAQRDMTIALLPIGYWDGYSRGLSNKGFVIVRNQFAPVIGIVSMNIMAIDITDIQGISYNDQVLLIANNSQINALQCAQKAGIITNEMVCRIHSSIPRIIINQNLSIKAMPKEEIFAYPIL